MNTQRRGDKATLRDVAIRAGVSIASVSRVLNDVPPISDRLRAQVESAVPQVGYKPKRTTAVFQQCVVVLIRDLDNSYFSKMVSGIQNIADRNGFLVNIVVNQGTSGFKSLFFRWLARSSSSGLMVCSSSAAYAYEFDRLRKLNSMPVVTINPPENVDGIPSIRIDYERAMGKAVQHAVKYRHSRIAFLNGGDEAYSSASKRLGVISSLEKAGHALKGELHVEQSPTDEAGFQALNSLLDLSADGRPTAIIASNDLMALGTMHAIRSRSFAIPDDMTVIGLDDIAMAAHANPLLTTIAPPKHELGAQAMEKILELLRTERVLHH